MRLLVVILTILFLGSCQDKEIQIIEPSMEFINLNNVEVGYNQMRRFDLDGNGKFDVRFATYHIGDPVLKMDKIQFFAASQINSYFPINADDNVTPLNTGDKIITRNTAHQDWYQVSLIVLAQKNITDKEPPYWTGTWKDASHQYLPIQIDRRGQRFNGWVELSFDKAAEKIILHRAAINTVPNIDIVAGQ